MNNIVAWSLISLLTIVSSVSIFLNIRVLRRNEVIEQWLIDTVERVEETYRKMRELDQREMFEKDDDVGILFELLKDTIISLYNKIEIPGNTSE
jgi:hypothetical protein